MVVGGGPTGVELAGSIAELARFTLARDFRHIRTQSARVILCEAGSRLLAEFPATLSDYTATALQSLGVEIRLRVSVEQIGSAGVPAGGNRIESENAFWCAGTQAQPAAAWLGVDTARNGGVKVRPDCSVPDHDEIFVIGDVASRIVVYVDWSWARFTYGRGARLIIDEVTLEQQQNTNPAGLVQAHRAVSR